MRCDEVIRELAVPTEDRDRTALAQHLAGCPSCGAWNRRAALLDRLWDATRPAEPSPEAWDSVWANLNQAIQSPAPKISVPSGPAPTQPAERPRSRRFLGIALIGLAQAAAILIALGLAWREQPNRPIRQNHQVVQAPTPTTPRVPRAVGVSEAVIVADIDIEEGRQIVIRVDGAVPRLVDVTPPEMAFGGIVNKTPGSVEMFNAVESFAKTVVASQ